MFNTVVQEALLAHITHKNPVQLITHYFFKIPSIRYYLNAMVR